MGITRRPVGGIMKRYDSATGQFLGLDDHNGDAIGDLFRGSALSISIAPDNSDFKSRADEVLTGTNDHVRINEILANEVPQRGARINLLAGQFNLTDELVIKQHNTSLEGEGWGFWESFLFATTNPAFAPGTTNPDGGFEGYGITKLKQTVSGKNIIRIDNTTLGAMDGRLHGITLRNMYLFGKDWTGTGISCNDGTTHNTDQLLIEKMFIQRVRTGMDLWVDACHVLTNTIMDCGGRGIIHRGNVFGMLWNNVIADNGDADGGEGIVQLGGEDLSILDNTFARVKIAVSTTAGARSKIKGNKSISTRGAAYVINSSNCTVNDNTSNVSGGIGIDVQSGGAGSSITENKIFTAGDHAIQVGSVRAVKVGKNHIVSPTYCGVYVNGSSQLSSVIDNTVISSGADSIVCDSPNVQIKDNPVEITVAGVSGISLLQGGCVVTGNHVTTTIASNAQKAIKAAGGALTSLTVAFNRSGDGSGSFTSAYTLPASTNTTQPFNGAVVNIGNA